MGRPKKYTSEEERKAAIRESKRKYLETHKAERIESQMKYYQTHKAEILESKRKYFKTPYGRALRLLAGYRTMDINKGFGNVIDFDAQWIVDNIFTQKCAHCDCTDWRELGCNRINNDLPHIKSNVECCCKLHNLELAGSYVAERLSIPIAQFDKISGELIAVWPSESEIERQLGYSSGNISACCNGKREQAYGFVWRKLSQEQYEHLESCLK